jgi:hypothetical protein
MENFDFPTNMVDIVEDLSYPKNNAHCFPNIIFNHHNNAARKHVPAHIINKES